MFTKETFQFNRGVPNCQATGEGLTSVQHSYISNDTIATITAPGYFPAHFNEEETFVVRGDILLINGSDAIVLMEILDTQTVTLGLDLFTSGTGSVLTAPFTVIAGDDISPVPVLSLTGITVRGNDPNIGYVVIGGDDTDSMMYAFASKSQGALGHIAVSPVGFLGVLPEIGMFNVFDPLNLRSVILDSAGVFSILGSAAVDTINEYTAANGTAINGVSVKGTRITLADTNVYLDNGVAIANTIKLNFSTSNNDYLYYNKLTRTFAYATGGVDKLAISPTTTTISNITLSGPSIDVDTINEFTAANGITMANVVRATAGIQSNVGFDTVTAAPLLLGPTNATRITFPNVPVVNFMAGNLNFGFGLNALNLTATGGNNVAFVEDSLKAITTGENNIGIGYKTLTANTNGGDNIAMGYEALKSNIGGNFNIALGWVALGANTTGSNNIALGNETALAANTTGSFNIALGKGALGLNTTAGNNIAIGRSALAANTTTSFNIAIGATALESNTTGSNVIGIGLRALRANTTANYNIAIGNNALESNTTGENNVSLGNGSSTFNTTGNHNVIIGQEAGVLGNGSSQNTIIGSNAAYQLATGNANVILGYTSGSAYTGAESANILISHTGDVGESNAIHIGTEGTHTSNFQAGAYGVTVAAAVPLVIGPTGQMGTTVSLRSKKENITDISVNENSEIIKKLQPVKFDYIGHHNKHQQLGLIADDVEKICPELCAYNGKDELQTVHYDKLGIMLLAEVQRLQEKIRILEEKSSCL